MFNKIKKGEEISEIYAREVEAKPQKIEDTTSDEK
jgi:hypothetical protein